MAKKRVYFDLRARIRDHGDCYLYETCLDAAAELNAPRVCFEKCPLWRRPHPREALLIAESIDWFCAEYMINVDQEAREP